MKSYFVIAHDDITILKIAGFNQALICHQINELIECYEIDLGKVKAIYKVVEAQREPQF
ncbi:MAG: hypothetical protein GQ574_28425 [Crocinitomix sp.]|nr:hypothetical protein [Crocinitomix sp.]